ncbi:MAG: hypothetical protein ACTSR2_02560 [Candidatus Hodarchaeales archaeon]
MILSKGEWKTVFNTNLEPKVGDNCNFGKFSFKIIDIRKANGETFILMNQVASVTMINKNGLKRIEEFFIQ